MKHLLISLSALFLPATLAAEEVNLYTHRHYEVDQQILAAFTEDTGIKVNVIKAKADELIERIKAEGEQSPADLLVTADGGRLFRAKDLGLLQPVSSDTLQAQVPENLRDEENYWYAFTARARVIVYAKDRVDPADLSTYEALADDEWKGRVLARSSSNLYNQSLLASIIANKGQAAAIKWAKGFRENMARDPKGSDRDQIRAVAAGLADVALANTYYLGLLTNSPDQADRDVASKVAIFFPNQGEGQSGAHINISGGGVTKHAPNKENAIKLLEYLTSPDAQKVFASEVYEYPVNFDMTLSPLHESWGEFRPDALSLNALGKYNKDAVRIFALAGWK